MKRAILAASLVLLLASTAAFAQTQGKTAVSMKYVSAQEALAADDFVKAKAALSDLAKESQSDVKVLAQAAANSANIAGMRKAFKPLSVAVAKMELPAGHTLAFCPMFEGGAPWVQKKDGKIANPYFGKAMLTCGEFKK